MYPRSPIGVRGVWALRQVQTSPVIMLSAGEVGCAPKSIAKPHTQRAHRAVTWWRPRRRGSRRSLGEDVPDLGAEATSEPGKLRELPFRSHRAIALQCVGGGLL